MLDNLLFCLNATIPVFLLMILGMAFMKLHIFDEVFVRKLNAFVFKVALPVLVFYDLCQEDFYTVWDMKYVVFCFLATLFSIGLAIIVSFLLRDKSQQGEFIQVAYRSSAAIMGIALVQNLYGSAGMTPLMIIGSVPLYNIFAVIVLALFKPEREPLNRKQLISTAKSVIMNPILIGVLAGLLWALLQFPLPSIADRTLESIARVATPLGLMALGATFDIKKALAGIKTAGLGGCSCHVRFSNYSQLLHYGKKYGTRWHADQQHGHVDHLFQRFYPDWLVIPAAKYGTAINKQ